MDMGNAVSASAPGSTNQIVVAGAGYAGLHVALRLASRLRDNPVVELTLVDQHDYHQLITELPRVAGGTCSAGAVRIPLHDVLADQVRFVQTEISGFGLPGLAEQAGPVTNRSHRQADPW
jgi:NADH dehydrogenase